MSCGVTSGNRLPGLFFLNPEVPSPLTCRYPKHTGCACHGQPDAASTRATGTASRNSRPAGAPPSDTLEAMRRRLHNNNAFIAKMLSRLRDFPDAAAAISEMLKPSGPPESDPPDFSHD